MPILAIFHGPGINKETYEAVMREVDWKQKHAPGAILHAISFDDKGEAHAVDLWESQAALDAYVAERLVPVMVKMNVPPPSVQVFTTHDITCFPAIDQFKV